MTLRADQLAAHVQRHGLMALYVLTGDEPLQQQEAGDLLRAAARQAGFSERQTFTLSGAHQDWSSVLGAAHSMGLFAEQQLIEIRLPGGKPSKPGVTALQQYASQLGDGLVTLIYLPRLDRQQQQSDWFKALEGVGVVVHCDPLERHQLPAWIAQRLAAQGQHLPPGEEGQHAMAFFADRVEGNLLAAHQELQKLALLHPPGVLRFEDIQSAVLNVARFSLPQLSTAVLSGATGRALRVLDGLLAEGESLVLIHWTLAEDVRVLKRCTQAMASGRPVPVALREARVWGERERLFERVLPGLEEVRLLPLIYAAQVCDGLIKGLRHPDWPGDAHDGLRRLTLMSLDLVRTALAPRRGESSPPHRRMTLRA